MIINKVTMTGADDSTNIQDLLAISKEFPFVEWGILLSRNSQGNARFPSKKWMHELSKLAFTTSDMQLSGHLCGAYVREMLVGINKMAEECLPLWVSLQRIQINTHGQPHEFKMHCIEKLLQQYINKRFIFQWDFENTDMIKEANKGNVKLSVLFDCSHGAGILPDSWPAPVQGFDCGYAGGLGPDNIIEQIETLNDTLPVGTEIWIDMETKVRSDNDKLFDLKKVVQVLEACELSGFVKDVELI